MGDPPPERPTRVRYGMIGLTTLVAVMLYLDRVCLGILGERIQPALGITDTQFADLTSWFFLTYALFQIPAGWLGDRYGPRRVLAAYLFLWSAATGAMGFADGFAAVVVFRLLCGAFEAGAYPLAAGVVRRWVPAAARGRASAAVAVGGRLGGAVAPVLTVWLAGLAAAGWRLPFWVYGGVGMAGAVVFYGWFRNRPADHPAVNPAEVALIGGADPRPDGPVGPPPLAGMATSRALWLASVVQFLANFAWAFIITLFPKYLAQVFETPERERAWYQAYPLYAGIVGMLLGGWLTDRAVRRYGLRWGRAVPVAASRLVVGAAYLACLGAADPVAVMLLMCVVAWATDVGTAPVWAYAQDVGGRHVGAVIGWANMWGNLGAWLAPMVLSRVARDAYPGDPAAGWDAAFLLCAATQLVAAAAALGIDARRPVRGA